MTTSTDERRARAILYNPETGRGWDHATQTGREVAMGLARDIRESDEAAGMVLAPREATEDMVDVGAQECASDYESYRTMAKETWNAMIAAATEADND